MFDRIALYDPEEHENRFLELLRHELTRFDVHLMFIKYHVNLGIDYDSRGNILDRGGGANRSCCFFPFM